ncbi:MAG TPA: serine/threonine protein kinase, partial [Brevundimonas sp.]|nr:serine/threonine protein kinase [Brevundimonas sp.]
LFLFQQRTLVAAVCAIVAGALLILVNLGVFVLFVMAVWTIVRGALGLKDLLNGRPIASPRRLFY